MHDPTRRMFVLAGLGFLAGCAGSGTEFVMRPSPPWEAGRRDPSQDPGGSTSRSGRQVWQDGDDGISDAGALATGSGSRAESNPPILPNTPNDVTDYFPGVITRAHWSTGAPIPSRMVPLTNVYRMTVHHDGMDAFYSTSYADCARRIDLIRRAHQARDWGDIGYHFVVDPAGRVWEGRSLVYQGAHVKDQNPGNVGIVNLGNFEVQSPSAAQLRTLFAQVARVQAVYRIRPNYIYTHREIGQTLCPGRNMQSVMVTVRRQHMWG